MEEWKFGKVECWRNGTPIAIGGTVEALAEIPLRREKIAKMEIDNWRPQIAIGAGDWQLPTADFPLRSALCKKHHQQQNL
jgi:hypothetical protein